MKPEDVKILLYLDRPRQPQVRWLNVQFIAEASGKNPVEAIHNLKLALHENLRMLAVNWDIPVLYEAPAAPSFSLHSSNGDYTVVGMQSYFYPAGEDDGKPAQAVE